MKDFHKLALLLSEGESYSFRHKYSDLPQMTYTVSNSWSLSNRFFQQDIYFIIYKKVQEICPNRDLHLFLLSGFKLRFGNLGRHFVQLFHS